MSADLEVPPFLLCGSARGTAEARASPSDGPRQPAHESVPVSAEHMEVWASVHDGCNSVHDTHVHPGATLSGVLHVRVPRAAGRLIFKDPRPSGLAGGRTVLRCGAARPCLRSPSCAFALRGIQGRRVVRRARRCRARR